MGGETLSSGERRRPRFKVRRSKVLSKTVNVAGKVGNNSENLTKVNNADSPLFDIS